MVGLYGAFGVGHHAQHVAALIQDTGDVPARAVVVPGVAESHAAFAFQPVEHIVSGEVVAIVVSHGDLDGLALVVGIGEAAVRVLHHQRGGAADEGLRGVAHQCAGQQLRLRQHLKAVAHAQHGHSALGRGLHGSHDGAVGRHGSAAQVIAVGEPARQGDEIEALRQIGIAVPHLHRLHAGNVAQGDPHVAVAIRAGECDDCGLHQPTFSMR